jgi:hypothetical protein
MYPIPFPIHPHMRTVVCSKVVVIHTYVHSVVEHTLLKWKPACQSLIALQFTSIPNIQTPNWPHTHTPILPHAHQQYNLRTFSLHTERVLITYSAHFITREEYVVPTLWCARESTITVKRILYGLSLSWRGRGRGGGVEESEVMEHAIFWTLLL